MPKESLLDRLSQEYPNSPQSSESGSNFFPLNGNFPQSKEEFRAHLAQIPYWQKMREFEMARVDVQAAFFEWLSFRLDPIYYKNRNSSGDHLPVVIVPGFATVELQYKDTAICLARMNYDPKIYPLRFILNIEPMERMLPNYIRYLTEQKGRTGRKIGVIGHSKGGLLTAAAYVFYRKEFIDSVSQIFFVGSPMPEWVNSAVGGLYLATQMGGDDFQLANKIGDLADIGQERELCVISIASLTDPIIKGQLIGSPENHFYVRGSHSGLLVNSKVLRIIDEKLSRNLKAVA